MGRLTIHPIMAAGTNWGSPGGWNNGWTGSGGGGGGYHASAVHSSGGAMLHTASLASTDNAAFSFVAWIKPQFPVAAPSITMTLWISDSAGKYGTYCNMSGIVSSNSADIFTTDAPNANYGDLTSSDPLWSGSWRCLMGTIDMATSGGKFYVGDVDKTATFMPSPPFNISSNGFSFGVLSDASGADFIGDIADFRIMPGTSLLTGGDIVLATRRLFIDAAGKPVDPATATAALGTPCMLFSGNASSFATNRGTGGSFALTGTLTNASTSPSD